jgi:AraC-like DNA-binding protein
VFILWYFVLVKYFHGIEWVSFNHTPRCRARISKRFPDYTVLDYNHQGEAALQLDGEPPIALTGPVAWFTYPGPHFRFGPRGDGMWDHRHIAFRGPRVERWLREDLLTWPHRAPAIPIARPESFAAAMDDLMAYLASPVYGPDRAVHMLEGLLLQLREQRAMPSDLSPTEVRVSEWMHDLRARPEAPWNFRAEARKMGLSYSHFRLLFHRLAGSPPGAYLRRRRMEKAAALLRRNQLEIKEIAQRAGIPDIHHFHKLFKRHFNATPGEFRNRAIST